MSNSDNQPSLFDVIQFVAGVLGVRVEPLEPSADLREDYDIQPDELANIQDLIHTNWDLEISVKPPIKGKLSPLLLWERCAAAMAGRGPLAEGRTHRFERLTNPSVRQSFYDFIAVALKERGAAIESKAVLVQEIRRRTGVSRAKVYEVLGEMEDSGMVVCQPSGNGRSIAMFLPAEE